MTLSNRECAPTAIVNALDAEDDLDEREHQLRSIRGYVESQARDESVTHVERMITTKVLGRPHEVWDVRTDSDRYWVVTNPTNLYSQEDFPSADVALTFHLGIGLRIAERSRTERDEEPDGHLDVAWRKYEQAVDLFNQADEAEAYQSVGIHCREALIALGRRVAESVDLDGEVERPKANNFKEWSTVAAREIATGRLRSYLSGIAHQTWDLAVWLQHEGEATPWDAELVLDATQHTIATFGMAFLRQRAGRPVRCPRCASYRVEMDHGIVSEEPHIQWQQRVCGACEHRWDHESIRFDEQEGWVATEAPDSGGAGP